MIWITCISLILCGLNLLLQAVKIKRKELNLLAVASFLYAIFFILVSSVPVFWNFIQKFSLLLSNSIGIVIGKSLSYGPSVSGFWIVIIFIIFSITLFLSYIKKRKYFAISLIGLLIGWIIFLVIMGLLSFENKSNALDYHFYFFLICLIPTYWFITKCNVFKVSVKIPEIKDIKRKDFSKYVTILSVVFLLISCIFLTCYIDVEGTSSNSSGKKILFYGKNTIVRYDLPEYGNYSNRSLHMFSLLPIYLTQYGYSCKIIVDDIVNFMNNTFPIDDNISRFINLTDYVELIESPTITRDILHDVDVFVVIAINIPFTNEEKEIIWDFVENGGGLLILGDHTDFAGIQNPLNSLLNPVDIRFRFDTAIPMNVKNNWESCYQLLHDRSIFNIKRMNQIHIGLGASLNVGLGSYPTIIGRYGFSDCGNHSNIEKAFQGDFEYNEGEQIGDVILAAYTYYGNGRVYVFGDTDPFKGDSLALTMPMIDGIFSWLDGNNISIVNYTLVSLSFFFLGAALIIYFYFKKNQVHFVLLPLTVCMGLIFSCTINPLIIGENECHGNIVYIDSTHVERFNIAFYKNDSLTGLMINLMRNNYLPLILTDFSKEKIKKAEMIIFNAPTKIFTYDEVKFLKQYIYDGGLVILATGYEDKGASMPLLSEFSRDIYEIPLGPVPYVEDNSDLYLNEPRFVDVWPIKFTDENYNSSEFEHFYNFEIFGEKYVLVNFTRYGKGGFLFICDSQFLLDKNIESLYEVWPGNILFIKNIITELKSKGILQ